MANYDNDYSKTEDPMMWQLHEIRNQIAKQNLTPKDINKKAQELRKKYKLKPSIKSFSKALV